MNHKRIRLSRHGILLALISSAFAGHVHAAAGRVEFAIGGATLSGKDGQQRSLAKGAEVNSGDVVRTTTGRVQVRMADGAYISLQPNTEFGIKEYKYDGKADGTESAFFSLLKGAMRTVTGLIGRVNRDRYQVATPTATVGIRGTGGVIQVQDDGSTLVQGTSGIWFLSNPSGSIDVPAGVSGVSPADPNQPPKETGEAPTAGPAPLPPQEEYVQGEQTESNGTAVITAPTTTPLQSGSGYAASLAYGSFGPFISVSSDATVQIDGFGRMTSISDSSTGENFTLSAADGKFFETGNDGIVAWGRWTGTVSGNYLCDGLCNFNQTYGDFQGFHYVIGTPTASMPTTGSASYTLLGATAPTYLDGRTAPGSFSGSLNVNFGALTVGVSLNAAMSDGKNYSIGGFASILGNSFSGTAFSNLTVSGSGGGCLSGCDALVQGFFAGTTAERAGLAYHVSDFTGGDVIGAATFKK